MNVSFDFSLFITSGAAFGQVTGTLDLTALPSIGSRLDIAPGDESALLTAFHDLGVTSIVSVGPNGANPVLMLENVAVANAALARELSSLLEKRFGYSVWPYEEGYPT